MLYRMKQRRGTALEWTTKNPVLGAGEIGAESDSDRFKIGDGVRAWNELPIALSSVFIQNIEGTLDADTLDGHESADFALASTLDTRTLQLSSSRKLITHWGAGTSFPVIGILSGDTFVRSNVGNNGSMWLYVGGTAGRNGWVHKGPIICTSTTRPLSTDTNPVLYEGLQIYETDTKQIQWYNGSTFVANLMARAQVRATVASPAYAANYWQSLTLNTADYDTHGMWSAVNPTRLTCKQAGDYLISGHIQVGGFQSLASRIIKNAGTLPYGSGIYGNAMVTAEVSARLVTLAVNDYVELQANVGAAGWTTIVAADTCTFLTAMRVA
jgi:hypothetical protein